VGSGPANVLGVLPILIITSPQLFSPARNRARVWKKSVRRGSARRPVHSKFVTAPAIAATGTAWKRRYRAARTSFPLWARDDADHLLYLSNVGGRFEVYAWNRLIGTHRQVTDRPEGTGYRVPSRLDPSGQNIWWFDDIKGNELGRFTREPFGGGKRETVAPGLEAAYSAGVALGTGFAVLGRSRGDEGTTIHVVREGESPRRIYQHAQTAYVIDLSRDEKLVAITHSEHGDYRNPAIRVLDLDGRTVADLWDGPGRGLEPVRWSPSAGDERLLVMHDRRGRSQPLIFDAGTSTVEDIELDLPGETFADWYPDAKGLLIGHEHRGRTELYRYDLTARSVERLDAQPGTITTARVHPDGDVWYQLTSARAPDATHSLSGGVVLRAPGEPAPAGVAFRDLDVDGVHVFIAEPAAQAPHPTIFIVHGGPAAHDQDAFYPGVQAWVDHGFAVVLVNYRGSSGYGKQWRDAIVGRVGLTELEDVAKVHDRVIAAGIAEPKRVVLSGRSWGGYLTLLGLGTQAERWSLGIPIVPIGDYIAAYEDEMEPLKKFDEAVFGGSPEQVPDSYRQSNPLTYVEQVRVPMLLVVGQNDPRCPSRSVDIYRERLLELGKKFEEYRYDAGHSSLVVDEQIRQVEIQIAFVARNLGTQEPIA
jgi:dipeptidyl aminopeptidase/acylaminoacyl peptidase